MNLLENLISDKPYKDKLVLGNYKAETLSVLKNAIGLLDGEPKVAILSNEANYLSVGKNLRDYLQEEMPCEAFVLENLPLNAVEFLKEYKIIISVGNTDWHARLAVLSESLGFLLISVHTSSIFSDAFGEFFVNPLYTKKGNFHKFILDPELIKNLSRNELADGYVFSSSLALLFPEYLLYAAIENKEVDAKVKEALSNAYKALLSITKENIAGVLIISQLYLGKAVSLCPYLVNSGLIKAGKVLANLTSSPLYECVFGLIGPLFVEIKGYLSLKDTVLCIPNVNRDIEKLAEVLKLNETDIYENFTLYSSDIIKEKKERLHKVEEIFDELDLTLKKYKRLKAGYSLVYKGRHKRCAFTASQIKTALCLGGITASGILKLMYDDGILTAFSEI